MPYELSEFEKQFFVAMAHAEVDHGQCEAFQVAASVPQATPLKVRDAVETYVQRGWLRTVIRSTEGTTITLSLSAEGRKAAESLGAGK
jgi:hypothetical protein